MNAMNTNARSHSAAFRHRAFTLIELIIVIALTAVLFGLLLFPLVSAIRYTQQAQITTAAQDAARTTRERLTRELGSALFVFDGTSHPFVTTNQTVPGDDRYTNFLNLEIPGVDTNGNYKSILAHAYASKLDFAQPRSVSDSKTAIDPTTGEPISYRPTQNGSAIISDPAYVFPLAAGTTVTRYWIGLKDPSQPYSNTREGKSSSNTDNTYVLYRAQFQPYVAKIDASGNPTVPPGVMPNPKLFAVGSKMNANGQKMAVPELDDPDFFRYVGPADVNWLDDTHVAFGAQDAIGTTGTPGSPAQHNNRVEQWRSIAKPVIPGPNVDLILLPHNTDNTLAYDSSTGAFPGFAHSGTAHDPVTGQTYPIVNTSVTFRPGTISGDAVPGTTSDYGSQGLPTIAGETGYGYVPTVYTATSSSWALPYHVSLYPGNYAGTQEYYDTQISSITDTTNIPPLYSAGDLLEFSHANGGSGPSVLVYNITTGSPLAGNGVKLGGTDFVPLTVNPDTGTLMFGVPSLPNGGPLPSGPIDRNNRNWSYTYDATAADPNDKTGGVAPDGTIYLFKPTGGTNPTMDSPLTNPALAPSDLKATGVSNAHIAPGGIRVTGPDTTSGPNNRQSVPYTPVNSVADVTGNQYSVDYSANTIKVSPESVALIQLSLPPSPTPFVNQIAVVYDYQANMTLTDPTKSFSADNPYLPMQTKVEYQTRDLIDVSIGVRIYDITNNRAQVIPSETKIKIGNSNRG